MRSKIFTLLTLVMLVTALVQAQDSPDSTFGVFTEVTPADSLFITPAEEDFWVISTAPADYDNDGDLDIAVLGYYVTYFVGAVERLVLMRNEGQAGPELWDFSYIDLPLGSMSTGASDMAWGDYDGDGDLDLVVGSDGLTEIYRNDTGNLVMSGIPLPGYWEENSQAYFDLRSITWADYDNDGDPDLLIPSVPDFGTFTYKTILMRNDGSDSTGGWIFTETDPVFADNWHAQSSWADCDADGDLDLLIANISPLSGEGYIRRYLNEGNGAFTGSDLLGPLSIEHGELQWGDYDDDGDLDILVAGNLKETNGSYTPMSLRIYRNDNENYVPVEVIPNPSGEGWFDFTAATWADYDSDGDMDILLAGHYNSGVQIEGRARIYFNVNGTYTDSGTDLPAPHAAGDKGGTFSWLDIEMDGDLDYLIAGEYFVPGGNGLVEAQMHLYRNDTPGQNEAPSAPSGLESTAVSGNSVILSWLPGTDDHTPATALTYDLRLFRDNVPVSLPAHSPEPGNVSTVTEWALAGLEPGNYTWKLNTIDASYAGSPVATGEFSLGVTGVEQPSDGNVNGYRLGQNYPNPVTSSTTFDFTLPADASVSLVLFNIQGQQVRTIANGNYKAGTHPVSLNVAGLHGGIYYYRLQSGDVTLVRELVKR